MALMTLGYRRDLVRADRHVEEPSCGYQQCDYNDDDRHEETRLPEIGHLLPLWKRPGQGVQK